MKKNGNILKYPIMLIAYILFFFLIDKLFGDIEGRSFLYGCFQGLAIVIAILLGDLAEKHGWDTWSGLISKFKKNK